MTTDTQLDQERANLIDALDKRRDFLRFTLQGLDDQQALERTTVSGLCLAGVLKHVSLVEEQWVDFIANGAQAMGPMDESSYEEHEATFRPTEDETLTSLLERYGEVAAKTTALIRSLPSLDQSQALPEAPWFPPGTAWSARQTLLHILAETAHHCGHADIVREALDGQKTMG